MRDQEIIGLWEAYQQVHSQLQEVEQLDEEAPERIRKPSNRNKSRKMLPGYPARLHNPKPTKMDEEAVENWVNSLIEEGYDLSDYTWEEMYEAYANLDEARTDPRGRPASGPMSVYGGKGRDAGPGGSGNEKVDRMDAAQRRVKSTQPAKKGMAADALYTKYSARQKGMEHGGEEGPGPKAPKRSGRSGRGANTDRGSGNAAKRRMSEDFDLFDTILEHLVAEGYADTNESALVIMANMSEEWRQSIVEVLDTPEKANEYGKKALGSMLGAATKAVLTKDKKYVKTVEKRTEGAKMAKRKAERKAAEES